MYHRDYAPAQTRHLAMANIGTSGLNPEDTGLPNVAGDPRGERLAVTAADAIGMGLIPNMQ
ncbi:unnamed protein product [Acanthoscelides obtectus]|uniref:Uncharacterized protein n=1 Tax=Acanthoscelides obtectus TaxID=200917 RepID=A0A9P0K5M7_ACAOB|nr:unnamed protein product [Acanthoscelides obtectus]CAK1669589.1 hypothetical protein AOBTE_LOCUS27096 [Acanthoscelides obtectus]